MKYKKGFIGMAIIILIAFAAIGGGTYVYFQNDHKPSSNEDASLVASSTISTVSTSTTANKIATSSKIKISSPNLGIDPKTLTKYEKEFFDECGDLEGEYKNFCLTSVLAMHNKNVNLCNNLPSSIDLDLKTECYRQVAVTTNRCDLLTENIQSDCNIKVIGLAAGEALKARNPNICKEKIPIKPWATDGGMSELHQDMCLIDYFKETGDKSLCTQLWRYSKQIPACLPTGCNIQAGGAISCPQEIYDNLVQ